MSKQVKTLLSLLGFIAILIAAMLVYNMLSDENAPDALIVSATTTPQATAHATIEATATAIPTAKAQATAVSSAAPSAVPAQSELPASPGATVLEEAIASPTPETRQAPDFAMEDGEGNTVRLTDFLGKPIVLNFWASWCPPCKTEMPHFQKLYEELGDSVTFIMVDLTDGNQETKAQGQAYIAEQGYSFPVYFDTAMEGAYAYMVSAIPMTLFIDTDGNLQAAARSAINESTLRRGIGFIYEAK